MKMSDFVNEVVEKAKQAAEFTAKKTNDMVEITKLGIKITDTKGAIDKVFIEIGKMVYEAYKEGSDTSGDIDDKLRVIDELYEKLSDLREKKANIKGIKKCKECGKENPIDNKYCGACSKEL